VVFCNSFLCFLRLFSCVPISSLYWLLLDSTLTNVSPSPLADVASAQTESAQHYGARLQRLYWDSSLVVMDSRMCV
jgi:hypothetical protein